ncbi:MAG: preprotein translocase subunit SecE [Actinomycetota bacterium]|nr:preprotein translocase subunit SecE [Actinomycetota bacterium]MDA8278907.1 preprotein translocase subunit SecE [Actinomycetota bacterium]
MNRETKRMSQDRDLAVDDGEEPGASEQRASHRGAVGSDLSVPGRVAEFGREVRAELRQVAWPNRSEVINSATIVLMVLVLLVASIFGLNWLFSHAVNFLLKS